MQKNKNDASQSHGGEMDQTISPATTLFYLLLLTCFFMLLEISFFIQCNKAYLGDFSYVSGQIHIPVSIVPGIAFFVAAQLFIHFSYCLLVLFTAYFCRSLLKLNSQQEFNLAIIAWMLGMGAVMAANQYYFPYSKFAELTTMVLFTPELAKAATLSLSFGFFSLVAIGVVGFIVSLKKISLNSWLFILLIGSAATWVALNHLSQPVSYPVNPAKPNIILIGIDSLRPDFLSYFGADTATPTLDNLLNEATVFSEAVTPLARTFPSWMSILTGQHPRESGIRSNLVKDQKIYFANSLPATFKREGYETIYATDETRFSNIDKNVGFNHIISPPVGLNDFLLGTFNDFPLSNLLVNTRVGSWLFPYSYANRPAFHTYNPDSFIELLRPALMQRESQPLFLAVHFCLPHYPYLWADAPNHQQPSMRYQASIQRVDQQIKSFMSLLNDAGLLENSIIVLLSDHGETLELSGDRITEQDNYLGAFDHGKPPRFYPPSLTDEAVNQSAGHGTDVLGLPQYHTLLAFKLFGMGAQRIGEVAGIVSLSEIRQTLLALVGFSKSPDALAEIIREKSAKIPLQHIMLESDFSPAAIRTVYPETRDVMLEGVQLYEIDPRTTRLTIKDEMSKKIIRSKQYADIYGTWMLAFYPQNERFHQPILINLESGLWTNDLSSKFARQSPALVMKDHLKKFYGDELQDI